MTDHLAQTADSVSARIARMIASRQRDDLEPYEQESLDEAWNNLVLEVTCRVGAPFALLLGSGGPHIEVVATLGDDGERCGHAELRVTLGSDVASRWGNEIDALIDHYTEIARVRW